MSEAFQVSIVQRTAGGCLLKQHWYIQVKDTGTNLVWQNVFKDSDCTEHGPTSNAKHVMLNKGIEQLRSYA
jgi:hypothetical protein